MSTAADHLRGIVDQRIAIHDGSWGVLIHRKRLSEADYRGKLLRDHGRDVQGDPDVLNLTRPDLIAEIHDAYFRNGRGHRDHEHVHRDLDRPGRLRARPPRGRDEPRGPRLAQPRGGGHLDCAPRRSAPASSRARSRSRSTSRSPSRRKSTTRASAPSPSTRSGELRRADRRARRGRGGHPPRRDDLRHAGFRRRRRSGGRRPDLPLWLSFTAIDAAAGTSRADVEAFWVSVERAPADRRRQLLARGDRDAALPRGARARGRHVRLLLPERGAPERDGRARRATRRYESVPARIRRGRSRQPRRRVLRDDAEHVRQIAAAVEGIARGTSARESRAAGVASSPSRSDRTPGS